MDTNYTIKKINQSRYNLKKYLGSEWDTSKIIDYSDDEISKIYKTPKSQNTFLSFGSASGCNITLYHKKISIHRLHVIYYNFPEIGKPAVKVTKMCSDKLSDLYSEGIIQPEDSLIIILYNPVPENLNKSIEGLYQSGQEILKTDGLSEGIQFKNDKLEDNKYMTEHFKNIHAFHLDEIAIDITLHSMIPDHECIRDQPTINQILEDCNATINQLPSILRTDAMAKRLRLAPGDICKIMRITTTAGETPYYRVCK